GTLLRGRGDGTFDVFQRDPGRMALAVGDLNGDGVDDFVFADPDEDRLYVEVGGQQTVVADGPSGVFAPGEVHLVDLNADGRLDLAVCNGGGQNVRIFPGNGDGTFGDEIQARVLSAGAGRAHVAVAYLRDVLVTDPVTGKEFDPYPDLIVASEADDSVTV